MRRMLQDSGMRGVRVFFLSLSLATLFASALYFPNPQPLAKESATEISAGVDKSSARVGEIVTLTVSWHLPDSGPLPEVKGLEDLTVLERIAERGGIRLRILVDRLRPLSIPALSIQYRDDLGGTKVLFTKPIEVGVLSNLENGGEKPALRAIQGIMPTASSWPGYLLPGGLALLALAAAAALRLRRSMKRRAVALPSEDPPHLRAILEIEALQSERLFEKGEVKGFYFRLSEILKRYLEAIRGYPAAELTTEEIAVRIDRAEDRPILPLLLSADLVKFAEALPTRAAKEKEVEGAIAYIQSTCPSTETGPKPPEEQETGR